jgi:hypothetical protein
VGAVFGHAGGAQQALSLVALLGTRPEEPGHYEVAEVVQRWLVAQMVTEAVKRLAVELDGAVGQILEDGNLIDQQGSQ